MRSDINVIHRFDDFQPLYQLSKGTVISVFSFQLRGLTSSGYINSHNPPVGYALLRNALLPNTFYSSNDIAFISQEIRSEK